MPSFYLISLGCPKNTVASEKVIAALEQHGYQAAAQENQADFLLVNTCAFINPAATEAVDTILELCEHKKKHKKAKLIVMGCLPQRHRDELRESLPEVDLFWGVNQLEKIPQFLQDLKTPREYYPEPLNQEPTERRLLTPGYTAFLKIAEGCNHHCYFCTIPTIKGKYLSRERTELLQEAQTLAENGVKELNLIAQDTTSYGLDLYKKKALPELLRDLAQIKEIEWLRILYAYPREITPELLKVLSLEKKICPYLDLPLQHCSATVLKAMGRKGNAQDLLQLIEKIRKQVPGISLRSTFIVGHPGEGENEFEELRDFLKIVRLDKVGVFTYSKEANTPSALLKPQIPQREKQTRRKILLELQQQISLELNQGKIGQTIPVLVEGESQMFPVPKDPKAKKWLKHAELYGRTIHDAPEIDGGILLAGKARPGDICRAKITDGSYYDLLGKIV